jgi:hypothetical protein
LKATEEISRTWICTPVVQIRGSGRAEHLFKIIKLRSEGHKKLEKRCITYFVRMINVSLLCQKTKKMEFRLTKNCKKGIFKAFKKDCLAPREASRPPLPILLPKKFYGERIDQSHLHPLLDLLETNTFSVHMLNILILMHKE